MAESRRVPFISLSPVMTRESVGNLIGELQRRNLPPLSLSAPQRSQPVKPVMPGIQQQPHTQRSQRETATCTLPRDCGSCRGTSGTDGDKLRIEDTVRLEFPLSDPTDVSFSEFSYPELLQSEQRRAGPDDPRQVISRFTDEEHERLQVERMARKFEAKYGEKDSRHCKDRMQDLIDIGYGYDETDPFIDNSEAYDELVPASLTTKYGGFYINTGTLQFRQASDTDIEDFAETKAYKPVKVPKLNDDDWLIKKRKIKEDSIEKEKPPRKKTMGVMAFNAHKPDKKKKKLYKDSLSLAAMIRKFQKEKEVMRKNEPKKKTQTTAAVSPKPKPSQVSISNDLSEITLGSDPVLALFGGGSEREILQEAENALEILDDFDFDTFLDSAATDSPTASDLVEIGNTVQSASQLQVPVPKKTPLLPEGLPEQLEKRIEDLQVASKMFDEEGRKNFFTQEMNNILLDIELQLQELSPSNRTGVYGYIEAFVPCTKDTLIKRLKKLHLSIQDDQLKEPLQRLKLAISSGMPGQLNRYQEECETHQSKSGKHQGEEDRERNPSEEEDEEKPGKRAMGPRKKFYWDDTTRNLLCNLVKIKLGCYELETNQSQSADDYLKSFMETEIKPLWPKGWMQLRMLFKESRSVHNHLTSALTKKKVIVSTKPKVKESSPKKEQKCLTPTSSAALIPCMNTVTPSGATNSSNCTPASETICLDDSLDEDLSFKTPSLDSVSEALAVLNDGTAATSSHEETPASRLRVALREEKLASIMSKLPLCGLKKADTSQHTLGLIAGHSVSVPKKPQDLATAHSAVVSGLIAGSSIQNPKVSLEPLPAKLLQQGMHRSLQPEISSSSAPAKVKASTASQTRSTGSSSSTPLSSAPLISSSQAHVSSSSSFAQNSSLQTVKVLPPLQQNYVTPLQATISKSHTNPVVHLTSSPQISSTSPVIKTPEKTVTYRPPLSHSTVSNQHTSVSRSTASSTSTNFMAKNVGSQVSNPTFKSPYSILHSLKTTTSPSSSSTDNPISPNNAHHKVSSSVSITRPSPTVSPVPPGRGSAVVQGVKNASASLKTSNSTPKLVTTTPKLSPSSKISASSTGSSPVSSPKIPTPNLQSQSPKPPSQSLRPSKPNPKAVNSQSPGSIKATVSSSAINVPIHRTNQNSSVLSRTHLSGATGSGTVGVTKQTMSHKLPASSGSPITAAAVQSAASLLANTSPLTLMASPLSVTNPSVTTASLSPFGMLGGLLPVNMPFQFPLELLAFGTDTAGTATATGSTSAAFHHNITQNLLKGLQTAQTHKPTISHSSLSAHLQQAFTDGGKSKSDSKLQSKNP